jgi:hypothetical protein
VLVVIITTEKVRSSSWRSNIFTQNVRVWLSAAYFLFAYGLLSLYTAGSSFCGSGADHVIVTAKLALACTFWDALAGGFGELAFRLLGKRTRLVIVASALATLITGVGLGSLPLLIHPGASAFLFENTWADVTCFFTEGYGLMFPLMVTPLLAVATFGRAVLIFVAQAGDESIRER